MSRRLALGLALVLALALTGCVREGDDRRSGSPTSLLNTQPPEVVASQLAATEPGKHLPLRAGERRMTLTMPSAYTPSAPTGTGTDDYRCFLLDPHLKKDVWLTGSNVLPGNPAVVHHVILFRVPPEKVAEAEAKDAESPDDQGWTCFGGTGLAGDFSNIDDASWLAAWAPGGDETKVQDGYGVRLDAGSRIVMQVHYNLLKGSAPDVSSTELRWTNGKRDLTPLHTYLMPAPVEMPCRPDHDDGPLCDRDAAVADVMSRFGSAGNTNSLLHLLCGTEAKPSNTTSCTRTVGRGMTVIGVAGHMHLLGRSIRIEVDPDTPDARTILDIPVWNFDNQGTKPIQPVHLDPFDTVRVTCHHVQWLRDVLPAFQGIPDKYVIWGEGTTDEMCLGMLQVAFDDES
ncbi:hypothetical protein [Nocardioides sp. URHA0032]|uniref:hypothetical protein n=1 Tax=Nocardioides sp. URHA0032 TaxID=1380388 RepID=UPI000ACF65E4|nr:hypothetical protein [Nocardioides sp. URHA0032]